MESNITAACLIRPGNVRKLVKMFEQHISAPTAISVQKSTAIGNRGFSVGGNPSIHRGHRLKGDILLNNIANVTMIINDHLSSPAITFTERSINTFKDGSGDIVRPGSYLLYAFDYCVLSDHSSLNEVMYSRESTGKIVFYTSSYNLLTAPIDIANLIQSYSVIWIFRFKIVCDDIYADEFLHAY